MSRGQSGWRCAHPIVIRRCIEEGKPLRRKPLRTQRERREQRRGPVAFKHTRGGPVGIPRTTTRVISKEPRNYRVTIFLQLRGPQNKAHKSGPWWWRQDCPDGVTPIDQRTNDGTGETGEKALFATRVRSLHISLANDVCSYSSSGHSLPAYCLWLVQFSCRRPACRGT